MTSATEVWASPEWYPVGMDRESRRIQLVRMSPETYRGSVFLDSRTHHLGETCTIGVDDLVDAQPRGSSGPGRVHYVFHTAFCCSTLLARAFESVPLVFVLKEPGLLSHLAVTRYGSRAEWEESARLILALLGRTYSADRALCIKASDWCNSLAEFLLDANPRATATVQMVPLRRFVLAVLGSPHRRRWAHARAAGEGLTDGQAAASIWLANAALFRRLLERYPDRVGALDGEELAARPGPCLERVVAESSLAGLDADLSSATLAFGTYSKGPGEFDGTTRSQEMRRLDAVFGPEADSALTWAKGA
jgi:hypothetical protein